MKTAVFLLLLLSFSSIEAISIKGFDCLVSIEYRKGDLKEPQPLILTDTKEPTFILPNAKRILTIPRNTSILLACPGRNNGLQNLNLSEFVRATCLSGTKFHVNSDVFEISNFTCKSLPRATIQLNGTCLDVHQRYYIGFTFNKYNLPLVEICRDETSLRTYYSKQTLVKEIMGYQHSFPRMAWKGKEFYPGHRMDEIYKANSQIFSLKHLLGSIELAQKFVKPGVQFLNRGHLVAKADFVYGSQQSATFFYLNTAPQWASFNGGNWQRVERAVRNFASERQLDLVVYTGVHGVTTLLNIYENDTSVYLHANETHKAMPVARFFWKIIHDPIGNRAIAFVGVNQPYAETISKEMYLCPDVSGDRAFPGLQWQPENIRLGVSYTCSVEELRKAIPTIPYIGEIGILS